MFADSNELFDLGLEIRDEALYRAKEAAGECAYCHTPPAPRTVKNPHKLSEWVESYGLRIGNWTDGELVTGGGSKRPKLDITDEEIRCLVCDSQNGPTIAIPKHILEPLCRNGLSDRQRDFLESELVLPICDVCRYSPHALGETAGKIMKRYVAFRFHGSVEAFELSGAAVIAREIAGLITTELNIQRQERRATGS